MGHLAAGTGDINGPNGKAGLGELTLDAVAGPGGDVIELAEVSDKDVSKADLEKAVEALDEE